MQRIIPHVAVWAGGGGAILALLVAQMDDALDVWRGGSIEVGGRMTVHVCHESVDVEVDDGGMFPRLGHGEVGRAELVLLVQRGNGVLHAAVDLGQVFARGIGEVLCGLQAVLVGCLVLREQSERRKVHEDKVAGAVLVETGNLVVDTVGVVCDRLAWELAVGQKGAVAKVVCADPDGVDGVGRLAGEELGAVGTDIVGVGEVGRNLIASNIGE